MTTKKEELSLLKKLEKMAVLNDPINPDLYKKFDVKRGLRNANGTGVLVGLTRIGDVVGYEIKDGEKIAIPGKLAGCLSFLKQRQSAHYLLILKSLHKMPRHKAFHNQALLNTALPLLPLFINLQIL